MKDGKNRTWIRTVTALAAVGGILGLFGCTGTAGNQQMERVPLLMAYEQGNPSWYMIDLTNQIYDFSEITLDYSSGASHEIIGLDSQMQPVDSAAIGDKPFVFAPEEGMAYIAFSVDEAGGESVSAEGTLSQEGMEARG